MKKSIALFDFDGTISNFDSTHSFYRYLYKSQLGYLVFHYFFCLFDIIFYRLGFTSYLRLKNKRLDIHTSKFNDSEFLYLTNDYYNKFFKRLLNPKAIDRIAWHKSQGHDVWVISASYDFLLHNWSIDYGINLITNKTVVINSKRFMLGKDVNYSAKVEYLMCEVDLKEYSDIYAYGDSEGDNALLSIAKYKFYKPFRN
jgi:HAD superfamily phosphoserine phosphatase-like hydrolase